MTYEARRKILRIAIGSRVTIFILQFLFNTLCPDHEADAFRGPRDNTTEVSPFDEIISFVFGGLTHWDGEYFIHIAKHGYTYDNTLAFYPLYPLLVRTLAILLNKVIFVANFHSCIILAGVFINSVCFVKSALIFYDLSKLVLKKTNVAYKAAILYCINPASIFFSALYSESLFAYLTFYTMLASIKLEPFVAFPLGLCTLVRSNGIVNLGFPVYCRVKYLWYGFFTKHSRYSIGALCRFMLSPGALRNCFQLLNTAILTLSPFLLLQIYNYITFCVPNSNVSVPSYVKNYGEVNNLILLGRGNAEWCNSSLPIAYSYIQKKYWNVGFLKYYEFKQIPNFLLAFPILYVMIVCIKEYICEHKSYFCSLGFAFNGKDNSNDNIKKYPEEMFVFVVHGLFLTISCIFFVHIQVTTRLICSASPLLYWYCALVISQEQSHLNPKKSNTQNIANQSKEIFFLLGKKSRTEMLILSYFLGYIIVGCFMFSNFLPWT